MIKIGWFLTFPSQSLFNLSKILIIVVLILVASSSTMADETSRTHKDPNSNGSAVSGLGQRTDDHASVLANTCSLTGHGDFEYLLATDLEKYRGDADTLLNISVNLQKLGKRQKAEIQRLQEAKSSNLVITPSKSGNRRGTDETQSSSVTTMSVDHDETVVVFSASDNELTVRHRSSMKGKALESFQSIQS